MRFIRFTFLLMTLTLISSCSLPQTSNIRDFHKDQSSTDLHTIEATFEFATLSKDVKNHDGSFSMAGIFNQKSNRA
jgi:hypothetical protein